MSKRVLLIRNPASAASRDQAGRLERMLQALGSRGHHVESAITRRPAQAIELARQAANVDLVVAVGGDGTVNEVASGLLQRGAGAPLLGILPFGTGNDIAQLVRTGDDGAFLGALDSGAVRTLDMMSVQCQGEEGTMERAAILFAAVGFASELLRQTTPRVKRWFGPKLCYSVGFFRALLTYRTPRVHLRSGDVQVCEPMLVAYAANAPHAGGGMMQLAPDASMEDGLLNLSFILQASRWEAATQFPRLLKGTHIGHPKVRYFKGTELELHADAPLEVAIDGEIVGRTPATIRLRPRALRVLGS